MDTLTSPPIYPYVLLALWALTFVLLLFQLRENSLLRHGDRRPTIGHVSLHETESERDELAAAVTAFHSGRRDARHIPLEVVRGEDASVGTGILPAVSVITNRRHLELFGAFIDGWKVARGYEYPMGKGR